MVNTELGTQVNMLDKYMLITLGNLQDLAKTRGTKENAPEKIRHGLEHSVRKAKYKDDVAP